MTEGKQLRSPICWFGGKGNFVKKLDVGTLRITKVDGGFIFVSFAPIGGTMSIVIPPDKASEMIAALTRPGGQNAIR